MPITLELASERVQRALVICMVYSNLVKNFYLSTAEHVYGDQEMHSVVRRHCMDYMVIKVFGFKF